MTDAPKDWPGLVEFTRHSFASATEEAAQKFWRDLRERGIVPVPAEATEEMAIKAAETFAAAMAKDESADMGDIINAAIAAGAIKPKEE